MHTIQKLALAMILCLSLAACSTTVANSTLDDPALRSATGTQIVGDTYYTGNYCIGDDLEFIEAFTAAVVRDGMIAYRMLMEDPDVPCYDQRLHGNPTALVSLTKKLWTFKLPDGKELVMWAVKDVRGNPGYVWIPVQGQVV